MSPVNVPQIAESRQIASTYARRSMERLSAFLSMPPSQVPHILLESELRILSNRVAEWRKN